MKPFSLKIPKDIAKELREARASIRKTIRKRLHEIVHHVGALPLRKTKPGVKQGPPPRFYVSEGYRVFYEVNSVARTVTVLKLESQLS